MARDPYEVVLADLRAKRDDIDKLIHTLEAYRPATLSVPQTFPTAAKQPDVVGPLFGLSIVDASKAVLRERNRPLAVAEIVVALREGGHVMNSEDPGNTIGSVLSRAHQTNAGVMRVGRGTWALSEWAKPPSPPKTVQEAVANQIIASGQAIPTIDEMVQGAEAEDAENWG